MSRSIKISKTRPKACYIRDKNILLDYYQNQKRKNGKRVGEIKNELMNIVLEHPELNTKEDLLGIIFRDYLS